MRPIIRRTRRGYVVVEAENKILVVKNWLGRQNWQLPGGGIRKGETPAQATVRELWEELGIILDPGQLKPAADGHWIEDKLGFKYYVFYCRAEKVAEIRTRLPEIIEAAWLPLDRLSAYRFSTETFWLVSQLTNGPERPSGRVQLKR